MRILAALLLVYAGLAQSDVSDKQVEHFKGCAEFAERAEAIMSMRQDGKPMHEVMSLVFQNAAYEEVVIEAYSVGMGKSEQERKQLIAEFRDSAFMYCYKPSE